MFITYADLSLWRLTWIWLKIYFKSDHDSKVTEIIYKMTGIFVISGVSRQTSVSDVSGDYANPPDNVTGNSDSDTSEPEQKLLKYTEDNNKHVSLINDGAE